MIKVCGNNWYNQLNEASNTKSISGIQSIFPPLDIKSDSLLCCSFNYNHTAIITQKGELQVIGSNKNYEIGTSLPQKKLKELTELPLKDNDGNQLFPISVVCGENYTLLLVSTTSSGSDKRLAFFSKETQTENPIFVSTGSHNPVSLFGGSRHSAAIDSEGGIIFINETSMETDSVEAPRAVLPGGEEAVSVACCMDYFYILGSSGRVFVSDEESPTDMKIVSELSGVTINEISGTDFNCIAVSSNGRVFGLGANNCGQLGFDRKVVSEAKKFIEISSLKNNKIISASAGNEHSLFITEDGKVLACGSNSCGQLLISSGPSSDNVYTPVETLITEGASFCIAGDGISIVFFG